MESREDLPPEVMCTICGKQMDRVLCLNRKDELVEGYGNCMLKGEMYLLCSNCYPAWTTLLQVLFDRFKKEKGIKVSEVEGVLR